MAMVMTPNSGLVFGERAEEETLIWFMIKNQQNDNSVSNLKFREGMIIIPKLLKLENINVSNLKHIENNTCFLIQTEKKNREKIKNIQNLGKIKCNIIECVKKNCSKGIIHHPSLADSNNDELLNDLKDDNENIVDAHIFTKKVGGVDVNTQTAVITFDSIELPKQVKYLKYNIIKTKQYYPNPIRCTQCFQYEHFHTAERPCPFQKVCGHCSMPYHLTNPTDKCQNNINCANCQGPHEAWSRKCPEYDNQKQYVKIMIDHKCTFREAKNIMDKKEPQKFNKVAATPQPHAESTEMKELQLKIVNMTNKMEIMCNLIQTLIKDQRKYMVVSETPIPPKPSEMEVASDTDSVDDDTIIEQTPDQPTVSDMRSYYTVDYTKGGNNNLPSQNKRHTEKRHAPEKTKDKEKKKKKEKHT